MHVVSRLAVGAGAAVLALVGCVCGPARAQPSAAQADTLGGASEFAAPIHDDEGDLSTADIERIRKEARTLRRTHGIVVGVQTVAGFGTESPQGYARSRARELRLGGQDGEAGVLIVVSRARGTARIQADEHAQALISDSEARQVEAAMRPLVRRGRVADAVQVGVRALGREATKSQASPQPEPIAYGIGVAAVVTGAALLAAKLVVGRLRRPRPGR